MTASASIGKQSDRLCISGELVINNVNDIFKKALSLIDTWDAPQLRIDLKELSNADTAGIACITIIEKHARQANIPCSVINLSKELQKTSEYFSLSEEETAKSRLFGFNLFEYLSGFLLTMGHNIHDVFYLIADAFYFAISGLFSKQGLRKGEFANQCVLIGMNSLPIIALISVLIGLILALQSAAQLRQFGASIFVADLIAISMAREMGPIMTAIVMAGRSGSAITSEIATMMVTEETDALRSMALNPIRYILVPKFYAITITMPMLTILSVLLGILGAFIIAVSYLEIGIEPFYNEVVKALVFRDIYTGLFKSLVFSWLIVLIAAYYGFRVRGGSEEVGRATTASVVASIFYVILADCILGLIFYFGKPIIV